jgi:Amt family ammonium transporter
MTETATGLCFLCILLVPFASAGLALINSGLIRSRSAAHSMLTSLCAVAIGAVTYLVCGFALHGYSGGPAHVLWIAGKPWDLLAAAPMFLSGIALNGSPTSLVVLLEMFAVGLAVLIPLGAGAERWRFGASCVSSVALAGFIWPLFSHWVWGGGWLAQLGLSFGIGRGFVDTGGAGSIHVLGGLTALSITWILGPRRGRYALHGMPTAIPGHNAVFVLFGCFLALAGWTGLNAAGGLLFAGVEPGRVVLVAVNTTLAAAGGALAVAAITRVRFTKPDASLSANGWVGGLVACSAGCAFLTPVAALVTGIIAGALVIFSVELLELRLSVDDPAGAISVHAVGGIWGLLAAGMFGHFPALPGANGGDQWLAQLIGIATLLGFVLPLSYGVNRLLNRLMRYRVGVEGERQGLDLFELGAGAYPDFVTHRDEFGQR